MIDIKTFEEYMEQFLKGVADTVCVDYSTPASVKKANRGVDLYRKTAALIDKHYPNRLDDFANLMYSDLPKVRICCAVSVLELTHYTEEQELAALAIIKDTMKQSDAAEKFGWEIWLKNWQSGKIKTVYGK